MIIIYDFAICQKQHLNFGTKHSFFDIFSHISGNNLYFLISIHFKFE